MTAAACAAIAVFLAMRPSPLGRCRRIFGGTAGERIRAPSPVVLAMFLAVAGSLMLFGLPTGLLVGAVAAPVVGHLVGRLESAGERRRRLGIERQLPGAIDLLIAALDAGKPATEAFSLVARATSDPLGSEFALIAGRLSVAADARDVWDGLRSRQGFGPLARSFARAARSGMPVGRVLERLAEELRRQRHTTAQERARSVAVATAAPLGLVLPACLLPDWHSSDADRSIHITPLVNSPQRPADSGLSPVRNLISQTPSPDAHIQGETFASDKEKHHEELPHQQGRARHDHR